MPSLFRRLHSPRRSLSAAQQEQLGQINAERLIKILGGAITGLRLTRDALDALANGAHPPSPEDAVAMRDLFDESLRDVVALQDDVKRITKNGAING